MDERVEAAKWMGHMRGNLLTRIRTLIEKDPAAMIRVGKFFEQVGLGMESANVFALQLAVKFAEGPMDKNGSAR